MNLEQKANKACENLQPNQKYIYKNGFISGYAAHKGEIIDFLKANQKATVKQVLEHLNGMK